MGFSRQEYWSRLLFPSPGDLPDPGIQPRSLALQADALPFTREAPLPAPHKNAVLGCNLKNDRMTSVCFQGKPISITVIQVNVPSTNAEEVEEVYEDL